nr:hypothetical protein [Tanacetum cinerariifolium]
KIEEEFKYDRSKLRNGTDLDRVTSHRSRSRTMDTTTDQQVAMDEALLPTTQRLKIGRSNFRLLSDLKSKESTLQLVYDVMRICPFLKAFLVDNKKHVVNLESCMDMLHICLRVHGQSFAKPPFEEEILAFIHFLGHSAAIRTLTDGLYHKKNIDYAYLLWEDFVYQVEHKNTKKSNEMYYPRFTKVIIHHFMSKEPSILRRNKVNWHYVRDDHMFSTIKLVYRHQNTQLFDAMLPVEITNEEIKNSNAYKEYYAIATGAAPPKPKASVRRTRSSSDTSITPLTTATGPRLTTSQKGKQVAKALKAKSLSALSEVAMTEAQQLKLATKRSRQQTCISHASGFGVDEGTGSIPGVPDVPTDESKEELSWNSTDDEGDADEGKDGDDDEDDDGEEGDDDDADQEVVRDDDKDDEEEGNGDEDLGLNIGGEEGHIEEEEEDKLYRDSSSVSSQFVTSMLNPTLDVVFAILGIIQQYMDQLMNEAVKVAVQIQSDRLRDEAQRDNDEFLKTAVNEKLEAEVLTRLSHSSRTSYVVAADLFEMELKKILIEKIEGNKSIQRSDEQRNLYKALVDAYEFDKIIPDTYGETKPPSPDLAWNKTMPAIYGSIQPGISELAKQAETRSSFNELMDTPLDFSNFLINWLKVDTLTLELLACPTYELMKGSCKSLIELEYHLEEVFKATTDQLDWVNPEGKLTNLTVKECFAFNVSLRMFTRSIVIQRLVEDLQLGVESYQKKLNLTKLDSYRSNLKRKEAYTAYFNPRGFFYQNKDKRNRLMRINELHKFSDWMLTDVRTALDDCLKGIQMQYLPQSIWRKSDRP